MRTIRAVSCAATLGAALTTSLTAQTVIEPDLDQVSQTAQWQVVNRTATVLQEGGTTVVRLSEALGSGFARLRDVAFDEGEIEVSVRGKNVLQRSFLGVAFHGQDDETWDAVYFRPFNFTSDDPVRRSHGVQYISHPTYTWNKLRTEFPAAYEQPVDPPPDPDGWFRARIVVRNDTVSVFVNDATEPSLMVEQLSDRAGGWVGLWVGSGSGGDFARLRIKPRE